MAVISYSVGGADFPVLEPGIYPAEISDLEEVESTLYTDADGSPKRQLQIDFTVASADADMAEDVRVRHWVGLSFSPKSKLTPIVQAVLGVTPGPGVEVDTDDLHLKHCQIVVSVTPATGDKQARNQIESVLAPARRKRVVLGDDVSDVVKPAPRAPQEAAPALPF